MAKVPIEEIRKSMRRYLLRGVKTIGRYASRDFMELSGRGTYKKRKYQRSHSTKLTWRTGTLGRSLRDIDKSPDGYVRFENVKDGVRVKFGTKVRYGWIHEDPNGWRARNGRHIQSRPFLRPAYDKFMQEGGFSFRGDIHAQTFIEEVNSIYKGFFFSEIAKLNK